MKSMKLIWLLLFSVLLSFSTPKPQLYIGDKAPEISLPNTNGDTLSLHANSGKLVLISFWASWCRPCRVNNHLYKKVYLEYKDSTFKEGNGFEIFSVSMDHNGKDWKSAIKDDKLTWSQHVSDLKAWDSPYAKRYDIHSIPYNCLIDSSGTILHINIHRSKLRETLNLHLK